VTENEWCVRRGRTLHAFDRRRRKGKGATRQRAGSPNDPRPKRKSGNRNCRDTAECSGAFIARHDNRRETTMAANDEQRRQHWEKTRNLTIVILIFWAIFSFVLPWNAHALNSISFMGFPLGFYFTAQGSLIAFVLMIWIQNWFQDRIDDECGMGEE
jgi:putative solute:sodium symporter small subunit